MKRILILLLFTTFFLAKADFVFAHATPIIYEPTASSVLSEAPKEVRIHFSERVEPGASSIAVYDPNGKTVGEPAKLDHTNPRLLKAKLEAREKGTYAVSWQVVSKDDGHFTKGAFIFSLGEETAGATRTSSQFQISHRSSAPEGILIWLELLGQAIFMGILGFILFLWKPLEAKFGLKNEWQYIRRRVVAFSIIGFVFVVLGTLPYILYKSAEIQGFTNLDTWSAIKNFTGTAAGKFALYRTLLASIFLGVMLRAKNVSQLKKGLGVAALIVSALGIVYMRARVSHAAAAHFYPQLSIFINFLHLASKNIWVGGAMMVSLMSSTMRRASALTLTTLLTSFSKIASIAFGVAGVSGAYIVWLHLKDFSNIFSTSWGTLFADLALAGVILLLLRLYHQIIADKAALKICEGTEDGSAKKIYSRLETTLPLEAAAGIVLLFITSFIMITTPPLSVDVAPPQRLESNWARLSVGENPHDSESYIIEITPLSPRAKATLEKLVVTLTNEEKNIGPIVAEPVKIFEGGYILDKSDLSPRGNWKVDITASGGAGYDAVGSFIVDQTQNHIRNGESKGATPLTLVSVALAILILLTALALYKVSGKLNGACKTLSSTFEASLEDATQRWSVLKFTLGATAIVALIYFSHVHIFKSAFHTACDLNGHFWNQSVPMKEGKALSPIAVYGCSVGTGAGQFHFGNQKEYEYFTRKAEAFLKSTPTSKSIKAGEEVEFEIRIVDSNGEPVRDLVIEHERLIHVVIIGEDLKTFAHIHAEDLGPISKDSREKAVFKIRHTFPKAGRYLMSYDFVVRSTSFSEQVFVSVSGEPKMDEANIDIADSGEFDGYTVRLEKPEEMRSRRAEKLKYYISDESGIVPNLEPYLGAPMHIAIVREDLKGFYHTHGLLPLSPIDNLLVNRASHIHSILPDNFKGIIETYPTFASPGIYRVFGEFKRGGKNIVSVFTVKVEGQ